MEGKQEKMKKKVYAFDIETTGLDPFNSKVVAIGLKDEKGNEIIFFAENYDEKEILEKFKEFLKRNKPILITFNGKKYDIPFLIIRAIKHNIDLSILQKIEVIDLYEKIKEIYPDAKIKLSQIREFLGMHRLIDITGRSIPELYEDYVKGNEDAKEKIIMHLKDDVRITLELWKRMKKLIK